MKQLDGLKLKEAKTLLRDIRLYADMTKKLGKRGAKSFSQKLNGTQSFVVEYYPALGEAGSYEQAIGVFTKSFQVSPEKKDITFIAKEDIKGGMKVYVDDMMVDLSYSKVEKLLQK